MWRDETTPMRHRMTRRIRTLSGVAAAFLALAGAGCGGDRPVAELEAQPAELRLDYPRFAVLTLTFRITGERPGGPGPLPIVFVHLLDGSGTVVRTFDHPFPAAWRVGATVEDRVTLYQSALARPLAPGPYRLTVGLYDPERRWPLAAGVEADRREYVAATVAVGGTDPDVPSFHFSESWLPPQSRGDVQVLAQRWLSGEGRIRLTGIRQGGTLWLRLRIPPPQFEGFTLTLAEGAAQPAVLVSSGCSGGEEVSLSGSGAHEVSLRVDPIEAKKGEAPAAAAGGPEEGTGGACEISLRPNFSFTSGAQALRQSAALEVLAWGPQQPAPPAPAP